MFTKLRTENYFFGILFLIFTIITVSTGGSFLSILILTGIILILVVWFNFIYKVQEESLIDKTRKMLKLKEYKTGTNRVKTQSEI